ncbi:MAG: glycosyltransferase family 2 protein [Ignavibacteria bacterium]|nr:glycosyltransferase family 2 protein [Ignavibacteria bacterium]
MHYDLSIILVNYNSEDCLVTCLDSIYKYTSGFIFEIIIVDNDSPGKQLLGNLAGNFNNLKIIHNNSNTGFGSGCNLGAKEASGNYLLFLNPDTEIYDNIFLRLIELYKKYTPSKIGALSPVFVDKNLDIIYSYNYFPNIKWELAEAMGLNGTTRITRRLIKKLSDSAVNRDLFTVDAFTGACILIDKKLFDSLSGFDEKLFLYYEDTDLQKRISDIGMYNAIATDCKIIHSPNTSTKSVNGDIFYYSNLYKSKLIFINKHYSFLKRNLIRFIHVFGIFGRLSLLMFRDKYRHTRKEYARFYKQILELYITNKT